MDLRVSDNCRAEKGTTQTWKAQAGVLGAHAQHSPLLSLSCGMKGSLISKGRVGAEQKAVGGLC